MAHTAHRFTHLSRRALLRLTAGTALVATTLGAGSRAALSADGQVLRMIHNLFNFDWSPLRGGGSHYLSNSIWWASPMYFDGEGKIQPYVFVSWTPSADNLVWTFSVDPAAVFSDGSRITAADVAGSWELCCMPLTKNQRVNQALGNVVGFSEITGGTTSSLAGLRVVDELTLEVTLATADPIFFLSIANHVVPVVKVSEARGSDGNEIPDWFNPGASYSGPFRLAEIDLDAGFLRFEANEAFFGPKPLLAGIEIQTVEDPVAAVQLLRAGEFQAHTSSIISPTIVQDLGQEFVGGPQIPSGQHYWFNASRAPMDDINVRKALIMAVDREGLMRATFPDGPHVRAEQILNVVPGSDDPAWEPYPFDPDAARAALAASRYGSAVALPKLLFVGVSNTSNQVAAQYIAEQWRQNLGITAVEMKPQVDGYTGPDQNAVQVFRDDVSSATPDPVSYLMGAISSSSGNARNKLGGFRDERIDRLLADAALLAADDPERISKAQEAQRLFRDAWMFLPWYHVAASRSALGRVQGIERNLSRQIVAPWGITLG